MIIKKRVSLMVDKKSDHKKSRQLIRLSALRRLQFGGGGRPRQTALSGSKRVSGGQALPETIRITDKFKDVRFEGDAV